MLPYIALQLKGIVLGVNLLIIIAGADYGQGSSRDWAAKGVRLAGVEAIAAEGFERIHRTNLPLGPSLSN